MCIRFKVFTVVFHMIEIFLDIMTVLLGYCSPVFSMTMVPSPSRDKESKNVVPRLLDEDIVVL